MISGWLCLDKPDGMSSNSAMIKVRKIFGENTGYVGTLDPFATGVLPIAIGESRKFIRFIEESEKRYVFTVCFGSSTDTLDKTGSITAMTEHIPAEKAISDILSEFLGEIDQTPPLFSAIKINGKRACDRVRKGESVELGARKVTIYSLQMTNVNLGNREATFEVSCSKGTYIRSLARDIAEKLRSLAHVSCLRRTKSGFFSIDNAIPLEKISEMKDTSKLIGVLTSIESPLDDIPALYLGGNDINRLWNGLSALTGRSDSSYVKIMDGSRFCGIGFVSADGSVTPVRMCINDRLVKEKDVDGK